MTYTARSYKARSGGYWGPFHIIGEGNTTLCGWYCGATSSTNFAELPKGVMKCSRCFKKKAP